MAPIDTAWHGDRVRGDAEIARIVRDIASIPEDINQIGLAETVWTEEP